MILVTGGAGFIGSNFIKEYLKNKNESIVNYDKLTYAGNLKNLKKIENNSRYEFIKGDICDSVKLNEILSKFKPSKIINFAAETHVDKSIKNPENFIKTNIYGTYKLIESTRNYFNELKNPLKKEFRFIHISTDEVFGSLKKNDPPFNEKTQFRPNSPYSASKASSDHLIRSYNKTFNIPSIIVNCSNNYGPFQFPEKLIPVCILNALQGKEIPIYGEGDNIRDWLYVDDHCRAIQIILDKGKVGETYNVGGNCELSNLNLVKKICEVMDEIIPRKDGKSYKYFIKFVKDRLGHDYRYSVNSSKITNELKWKPKVNINDGLKKTINWYIKNQKWISEIQKKAMN